MGDFHVADLRLVENRELRAENANLVEANVKILADLDEADALISSLRDENDALKAEICELQAELSEWSDHG